MSISKLNTLVIAIAAVLFFPTITVIVGCQKADTGTEGRDVGLTSERVYELKVRIIGPGPMGVKKATNIELAAERLNQIWKPAGAKVDVEVNFSTLKWGPFEQKFYIDFKAGKAPDILNLRWDRKLADGGFIVPLDKHVKEFWDFNYYDFYNNLWEGVTYKGKIWGVPNDISPVGIWYRKDILRKLGYTDQEISKMLPESGKTRLDKLAKLAEEAVHKGLVEYGILHRPSIGSGFYATLLMFGVDVYDSKTDNLILDKPALVEYYKWHARMVKEGVIPPEPPSWRTIHTTFVEGKTFSTWASHVGTPSEWKEVYGLKEKDWKDNLGFMLFPPAVEGVEPVSVHEFAPYIISSQCKYPEVAALLIMFATSPEECAIHSSYALRPPYRKASLDHPEVKDIEHIQRIAPSVKFIKPVPVHPQFWPYMYRVFEALKGVEAGIIKPEEAVKDLEFFADTVQGMKIIKE